MAVKEARLEVRLDESSKQHITQAAELSHESVSAFVVRTAAEAAEKVLASANSTVMPADQFDDLLASLDVPDEVPVLARVSRRERRYRRV